MCGIRLMCIINKILKISHHELSTIIFEHGTLEYYFKPSNPV